MKRVHLSNNAHINRQVTYLPYKYERLKPNGLWYSIDGSWLDWTEQFIPERKYAYGYELEIDLEGICVIASGHELDMFIDKYAYELMPRLWMIDWEKVKADYTGIELRGVGNLKWGTDLLRTLWVSAWDVDGGCIWDLNAIEAINISNVLCAENFRKTI